MTPGWTRTRARARGSTWIAFIRDEVDDQPAVAERPPADVVSAAADRDEEVVVAREVAPPR